MSLEVRIFENSKLGRMRVVMKDGTFWFVVKDICRILGLLNPTEAISRLEDEDKGLIKNPEGSRTAILPYEFNVVSEFGLYSLAFRCHKPAANKFCKWVFSEVIPSLHKMDVGYNNLNNDKCLVDIRNVEKIYDIFSAIYQKQNYTPAKSIAYKDMLSAIQVVSHADPTACSCRVRDIPWLTDVFANSRGLNIVVGRHLIRISNKFGYQVQKKRGSDSWPAVSHFHADVIETYRVFVESHPDYLAEYRRARAS